MKGEVGGRWSRMGLRQRLQLLTAAFVGVLITLSLAGVLAVQERDESAADRQDRVLPMLGALSDLGSAVADREAGVRGFVLTGDERSLDTYREGQRTARAMMARLQRLAAGDTQMAAHIDSLADSMDLWQSMVGRRQVALVRAGMVQEASAVERAALQQGLPGAVRRELDRVRILLREEQARAETRANAAVNQIETLLWSVVGLALAFTIATALLMRRWITAPLAQIAASVNRVASGEAHHRIPAVGPGDLATVAAGIEVMRAETVRRLDDAVRAREALEQQGPAVVTLRAELSPHAIALPAGLAIGAAFRPAEGMLAGDWYDLMDLGDGRVMLVMADVAGHGAAAGVFALRAKHLLGAVAAEGLAPGAMLGWLATHLGETHERFLTALALELDTRSGRVRWANAGHPSAVLVRPGCVEELDQTGPLIGPFPGVWYTRQTFLPVNARLLAHTDGLLEARCQDGSEFGRERLLDLLEQLPDAAPDEVAAACVAASQAFASGHAADDITVVAITRLAGRREPVAPPRHRSGDLRW